MRRSALMLVLVGCCFDLAQAAVAAPRNYSDNPSEPHALPEAVAGLRGEM